MLLEHFLKYMWSYRDTKVFQEKYRIQLGSSPTEVDISVKSLFLQAETPYVELKASLKDCILAPETTDDQLAALLHNLAVLNYAELTHALERPEDIESEYQDILGEENFYKI